MRYDLPGRTVVITGAGGGLGDGLARALRAAGANVALLDLDAEALRRQAEHLGGERFARGWSIDVRDLEGLRQVMGEVAEHFGGIDVVVAGAGVLGALETIDVASATDWDRVIDVNLNGAWRTLKAAAPHVAARRGHMVAVSSLIAYVHPPLLASYAASKAGVAALCDVLRLELRAQGVTVGTVHPAIFRTPMIGDALSSPAATALVDDFTGVFQTVPLETVVDEVVRGIERRAPHRHPAPASSDRAGARARAGARRTACVPAEDDRSRGRAGIGRRTGAARHMKASATATNHVTTISPARTP